MLRIVSRSGSARPVSAVDRVSEAWNSQRCEPSNPGVTSSIRLPTREGGLPSDHRNSTKTLPPIGMPRLSLLLRTMTAASR